MDILPRKLIEKDPNRDSGDLNDPHLLDTFFNRILNKMI